MKPVLMLIPGMLNDARVWSGVMAALADHADVRIANVTAQSSIAVMADDAWSLIEDVPDSVSCLLAGFSMGGYVAIEMLAQPRRAWRAAALLSTSAEPETSEGAAGREKAIVALRDDFAQTVQTIARRGCHSSDPALQERLRQMMLDVGSEVAVRQTRAIMGRGDHREALAALKLPVRVLCGRHDRITPPALSQALADLIPQANLQLVEDAGHMLPCEQAPTVADALRDWLN